MESPLLARPGAVAAQGRDAGVAAHYGNPAKEQRALDGPGGLADRSNRGVVRITGEDRLSWLQDLTTQDVRHLEPGSAAQALILSANGHVQHHLTMTDDGTAVWIHTEPGGAGPLLEFLRSMQFLLRVDPADVTDGHAVVSVLGAGPAPEPPDGTAAAMTDSFGMDLIIARDALPGAVAELERGGAAVAGLDAYEALRIAARRPRLGLDTDHRTIPHEVGWIETAVHLDKGCYRGQETVARVQNLGHPPRRLVFLHLDGTENRLPAPGDPVTMGDAEVGFAGSAARHYEQGPIALAVVRRSVLVDAMLRAGGVPAAQEVVVSPDAGGTAQAAVRQIRGGLRGPRR